MYKLFGKEPTSLSSIRKFQLPNFESAQASPEATRVYVFKPLDGVEGDPILNLEQAKQEAADVLSRAKAEADRLKKEAEKLRQEGLALKAEAAQKGREEGFAEGLKQGLSQGIDQSRSAFNEKVGETVKIFEKIQNLYQHLWQTNEPAVVQLAMSVAERVVFHELSTSPDLIKSAFQSAVDHLQEQHEAAFRVHPDDLECIQTCRDDLKDRLKALVKVTIVPDPTLKRGDIIMETEAGRLDATVKRRIESVRAAVEQALSADFDLDW